MLHRNYVIMTALAGSAGCALEDSSQNDNSVESRTELMSLTHDGRTIERVADDFNIAYFQPAGPFTGPSKLIVDADMQVGEHPEILAGAFIQLIWLVPDTGPIPDHLSCDGSDFPAAPVRFMIRFLGRGQFFSHYTADALAGTSCDLTITQAGAVGEIIEADFTANLRRVEYHSGEPLDEMGEFTGHLRLVRNADD